MLSMGVYTVIRNIPRAKSRAHQYSVCLGCSMYQILGLIFDITERKMEEEAEEEKRREGELRASEKGDKRERQQIESLLPSHNRNGHQHTITS